MRLPGPSESLLTKLAKALMVGVMIVLVFGVWGFMTLRTSGAGWDFPVFYIAGKLPLSHLYDRVAFEAVWKQELEPIGVPHWAAYIRPSAFAVLLRPLASMPYGHALWLWMGLCAAAYLTSVGLLVYRFQMPGYFVIACIAYFPAMEGIVSGQDAAFYLLAVVVAMLLLERGLEIAAGMVLVICLCKFNLAMLVPVALLTHRRYKALVSFGLGAICIGAISFSATPLPSYISAIAHAQSDTAGFYPVGLRGFSVAIGQPWCYAVLAAVAAAVCCWLMIRLPLMESICIAITGALLVTPYVAWYDSTLLVFPLAILFARGNPAVRWAALAVIVAIPLWEVGGGNNGPIGFMHVAVEVFVVTVLALPGRLFHLNLNQVS